MAAKGQYLHGEADLVGYLVGDLVQRRILDAGCGTGRVGIELARRGADVVGMDRDPDMLQVAKTKAPELSWILADLAAGDLPEDRFDLVLAAGNVLIFLDPGSEQDAIGTMTAALAPGGYLVSGFQLTGRLALTAYDDMCATAGLLLEHRWATWERSSFSEGDAYAVSVHRLKADPSPSV